MERRGKCLCLSFSVCALNITGKDNMDKSWDIAATQWLQMTAGDYEAICCNMQTQPSQGLQARQIDVYTRVRSKLPILD